MSLDFPYTKEKEIIMSCSKSFMLSRGSVPPLNSDRSQLNKNQFCQCQNATFGRVKEQPYRNQHIPNRKLSIA